MERRAGGQIKDVEKGGGGRGGIGKPGERKEGHIQMETGDRTLEPTCLYRREKKDLYR